MTPASAQPIRAKRGRFGVGLARAAVLAVMIATGSVAVLAQSLPLSQNAAEALINQAASLFAGEPRFKEASPDERRATVEFMLGNTLFVALHEMGHGILAEMELPNLGRDEDAADTFAILTLLKLDSAISRQALIDAAKGWYVSDLRDRAQGSKVEYYDQHGLNLQRAYQIVCLLVGSNPERFKPLADIAKLPAERQKSCEIDYAASGWSWDTLLKPHRRSAEAATQTVAVHYEPGKGDLVVYSQIFQRLGFLETMAKHFTDRLAWPRSFEMTMETCGYSGANWRKRKLRICYELAQEFAELYRDFGQRLNVPRQR